MRLGKYGALGYDDMEIMRMLAATIEFVPQPNRARRGPPLLADQLAYDRIVHRCSPFRVRMRAISNCLPALSSSVRLISCFIATGGRPLISPPMK